MPSIIDWGKDVKRKILAPTCMKWTAELTSQSLSNQIPRSATQHPYTGHSSML
jgi:hypothetical protein